MFIDSVTSVTIDNAQFGKYGTALRLKKVEVQGMEWSLSVERADLLDPASFFSKFLRGRAKIGVFFILYFFQLPSGQDR